MKLRKKFNWFSCLEFKLENDAALSNCEQALFAKATKEDI